MGNEVKLCTQALEGKLHEYQPIKIMIVNKIVYEKIWDEMVRKYHYLGYEKTIGQRIKYLVLYKHMPIAALGYNRAAMRVGVRDTYIGWGEKEKLDRLVQVVNNNRFLILPWIKIKNLASHLLSQTLKLLRKDWYEMYGNTLILAETFVDQNKYEGTCYLAANWKYLGETKGYGKVGNAFVYHGNRKGVYIYELDRKEIGTIQERSRRQTLKTVRRREPNMMLQVPDWNPGIIKQAGITEEMVTNLGVELAQYLEAFEGCFIRDQDMYAETYIKGLMSDLEYKSAEPIALRYGMAVRNTQRFLKDGKWDSERMAGIYKPMLSRTISHENGMITLDGCDNPKKGNNSVGVARQYCGATGKIDNCQAGVFIGYSSANGYGLIDRELYMPEKWFDDEHKQLRKECGVPEDTVFKTKIEIASAMVGDVVTSGLFPARWVGVDSFFGNSKDFLASIPEGVWYFADIHSDTLVFTEMPTMKVPPYSGRGRRDLKPVPSLAPISVTKIASDESIPCHKVILGEGSKGPIISYEKCVRVVMCDANSPGNEVWLYIRRLEDGSFKFSFCNAPADTPIEIIREAALMRWPIEQCFEECKSCLGLDQYEGRSWNTWYRHTLLVFISHLFLTGLRLKYKKKSSSYA